MVSIYPHLKIKKKWINLKHGNIVIIFPELHLFVPEEWNPGILFSESYF